MRNSDKKILYYFIVIGWYGGQAIKDYNLCGVEIFSTPFIN